MNRIFQYLVYPIVWLCTKPFFDVEFRNPEGLKQIVGRPAIVVANHIAYYDTFLLRLNPYSVRGLSLYFMGVKSFNASYMRYLWNAGIVPIVYRLFGVFIVYPGKGLEKNLETPRRILSKNNQILIFPEGSVNRTGILRPFKKGAAVLASTMDILVLPVSYKEVIIPCKRKKIVITIGDVINFANGSSVESVNLELQQKIQTMLSI